ncbi:MAG: alpha/beta hydrolase [Rhizobiaceae bacterium]|nr:alpha/beta hydrolase [Rhizobiaceae bacterium]MCV0407241.1 alpha/beta hydrolase [Rhizobiaceae bacterium]
MTAESFIAVADGGAELQAWSYGAGPETLLLVSGLGGTAGFWKGVTPSLAEERRVLCFDQRGIGASTRGRAAVTIEQLARDCLAALDAADVERCLVLGHSTGGCICQTLARIAPERATGLILSATWMRPSRYMGALFGARRELLEALPSTYTATSALLSYPPEWLEENWHVYDSTIANAPATREAADIIRERIDALLAFDGSADAQALNLPALVLGARDDIIVPPFLQEELRAALPSAKLTMLDSGGHFFPLTRGKRFVAEVSRWIAAR